MPMDRPRLPGKIIRDLRWGVRMDRDEVPSPACCPCRIARPTDNDALEMSRLFSCLVAVCRRRNRGPSGTHPGTRPGMRNRARVEHGHRGIPFWRQRTFQGPSNGWVSSPYRVVKRSNDRPDSTQA